MKVVSALIALVVVTLWFNSCKQDSFPVPPASTVSKFTYSADNESYAPANITFTSQSIVPDNVGDAHYTWIFGDGTRSNEKNPVHTFTSPGSYNVSLIVKTTVSLEIKEYSQTIVILNAGATGTLAYFTNGSNVFSGYLNDEAAAFTALPIGPFEGSYGMAIDTINSRLYISDSDAGIIYQYDTETGSIVNFRTGLSSPDGLAIDAKAGKLYWDTSDGIQRTSLSSTTPTDVEDFVTGQDNDPEGVSIDATNNKLYWICYDGGLWSINLDGTGKTELLAEPEGGSTLVVGNRLYFDYYVASGDIHIKSTDLNGKNMSTVATGVSKVVFGLAYESKTNKIFWGDRGTGKIMRSNLDGSNIETWYSASGSSPRGIVFGKKN
jgi:PKD repeat protein